MHERLAVRRRTRLETVDPIVYRENNRRRIGPSPFVRTPYICQVAIQISFALCRCFWIGCYEAFEVADVVGQDGDKLPPLSSERVKQGGLIVLPW